MNALELAGSFLLTLALHATVLLGAVWLAERLGWLRNLAWAELAWRAALFGALLSASLEFVSLPRAWEGAAAGIARQVLVAPAPASTPGESTAPRTPVTVAPASVARAGSSRDADAPARATATGPARAESAGTPSRRSPTGAITLPDLAVLLALGLWFAGITLGGLRLARQAVALRRLARSLRARGEPASAELARQSGRLAGELGIPAPLLRMSPLASSPMVLPGASVLLPTWSQSLEPRQQRALLAHELSHLQRQDPAWRIAQRIAVLPLFFHPLAWHARRRLESLAEDACDARAAQLLGSGRPLAECLATCLSHAGQHAGHPALAVAMVGESGPVLRRVQQLLEDPPMSLRPLSPALRRTALALGLVALVALPGLAITTFATEAFAESVWSGGVSSLLDTRDNYTYRSNHGGDTLKMTVRGVVEYNAAETDVLRLARNGELELAEKRNGTRHRLHVFAKDGVIQRRYWLDGDEQPLDADGRAWLADTLPRLLRETGINAEARGKRLLAEGGPDKLLADIALIESDHAAAKYLGVLFANAKLDAAQTQRALQLAKAVDSDFELSQMLASLAGTHALEPALLPAWRELLAGIGSDFEKRRVLEALLARSPASPQATLLALEGAADIGSDFELRQVLEKAAGHTRGNPAVLAAYLQRCSDLGSDFELREALVALVDAGPVDLAIANGVIDSVDEVGSDFEAAQVLQHLAGAMPNDASLIERYRASARQLGDFERGRTEKALDRFVASR